MVFGNPSTRTETWNGTSWSEVADVATGRSLGGSTTGSTTVSAMYCGGSPNRDSTEEWNDPVYAIKTVTVS